MTQKLYTVELFGGRTGLIVANNLREAQREANDENGKYNVSDVRIATDEEIDWVRAMGGYVPDLERINAA